MKFKIDVKKTKRVKSIDLLMKRVKKTQNFYKTSSPAWTLLENYMNSIHVLHHLETQTNFDNITLGVKDED